MNLPLPTALVRGPDGTGSYFDSYTATQMTEYGQACFEQGVSSVHTQEPVGTVTDYPTMGVKFTEASNYGCDLTAGTKLYTAPQSEDDKALHKLGCEMLAMTTTVHSPDIPFVEQCALVPSVWKKFFDDNKVQSTPQQPTEPLELSDATKRDLITNWFADWWTQKAAHGLLEDYASAILAAANAKRKPT